jgi:hypothetical protein
LCSRRLPACLGLALGALGASGAMAQLPALQVPEGIEVGPWVVRPLFRSSFSYDSNVFRIQQGSDSDRLTEYEVGLTAILPFRLSRLRLDYRGDKVDYQTNQFSRDLTHTLGAELQLTFRTGDRLTIRDSYRRDISRLEEIDEGNELVFHGEPYSLNRWEIELERADPGRQGYLIRVRRQDYTYDQDIANAGFFEYRGFDDVFEYRQPLTSYRSWTLRYATRRFNHFDPAPGAPVGVPFRREESDSLTYGLRGMIGERQPYQVQLGYGRFRSRETGNPAEFTGLVGTANWRVAVGGRTGLGFDLARRPLPSSFETYYINNALRVELDRQWMRFRSRATVRLSLNDYGPTATSCNGEGREDLTWGMEAGQGWRLHDRVLLDLSAFYEERSSNCAGLDFHATGISAGVSLGWF